MEIISIPEGGDNEVNLPLSAQSCDGNAALLKSSGRGPLLYSGRPEARFGVMQVFNFTSLDSQEQYGRDEKDSLILGDSEYCNAGKYLAYMQSMGFLLPLDTKTQGDSHHGAPLLDPFLLHFCLG